MASVERLDNQSSNLQIIMLSFSQTYTTIYKYIFIYNSSFSSTTIYTDQSMYLHGVVKDYIFWKKRFLNLFRIIVLVSFPSGGCPWGQYCQYSNKLSISFSVIHLQSNISWMTLEFVGQSEELFFRNMYLTNMGYPIS